MLTSWLTQVCGVYHLTTDRLFLRAEQNVSLQLKEKLVKSPAENRLKIHLVKSNQKSDWRSESPSNLALPVLRLGCSTYVYAYACLALVHLCVYAYTHVCLDHTCVLRTLHTVESAHCGISAICHHYTDIVLYDLYSYNNFFSLHAWRGLSGPTFAYSDAGGGEERAGAGASGGGSEIGAAKEQRAVT